MNKGSYGRIRQDHYNSGEIAGVIAAGLLHHPSPSPDL